MLVLGYETFWLSSLLEEKRELTTQVEKLLKQKVFLENDLSTATARFDRAQEGILVLKEEFSQIKKFNIYLKKKATQLSRIIHSKVGRLKEANSKLTVLSAANNVLEKQIEGFQDETQAQDGGLKNKVEVILTPQNNQE